MSAIFRRSAVRSSRLIRDTRSVGAEQVVATPHRPPRAATRHGSTTSCARARRVGGRWTCCWGRLDQPGCCSTIGFPQHRGKRRACCTGCKLAQEGGRTSPAAPASPWTFLPSLSTCLAGLAALITLAGLLQAVIGWWVVRRHSRRQGRPDHWHPPITILKPPARRTNPCWRRRSPPSATRTIRSSRSSFGLQDPGRPSAACDSAVARPLPACRHRPGDRPGAARHSTARSATSSTCIRRAAHEPHRPSPTATSTRRRATWRIWPRSCTVRAWAW